MIPSANITLPHDILYGGSISLVSSTFVLGISWGFMTAIYVVCMYSLIRHLRSSRATRKRTLILTVWVAVLWVLSSLYTISNTYCTLYAYSWQLDYPGGPIVYLSTIWGHPVAGLAYASYLLTMWLADALLLWRLIIFYKGVHALIRGLIFSFMFLTYLAAIGTGCFTIVLNISKHTLYSDLAKRTAIPCFALSVMLNVFATALITIRLLMYKKVVERSLGKRQAQSSPYTSIAAMLIESSALYATWSLVFIILYATSSPGRYVMLITLGNVQVIAPLLIVHRVSRGMAWEETTLTKMASTREPGLYDSLGGLSTIVMTRRPDRQTTMDSELKSGKASFARPE